ncbi:hypothetical protein ACJX0J_007017, partial [Zea mays]
STIASVQIYSCTEIVSSIIVTNIDNTFFSSLVINGDAHLYFGFSMKFRYENISIETFLGIGSHIRVESLVKDKYKMNLMAF